MPAFDFYYMLINMQHFNFSVFIISPPRFPYLSIQNYPKFKYHNYSLMKFNILNSAVDLNLYFSIFCYL